MVVVALVSLVLALSILVLVRQKSTATTVNEAGETVPVESTPLLSWKFIQKKLTDAVPVEEEESIDMGHDYDGIRELDNNLPPWWKYGFYLTIVFAVVYLWYYHVSSDWSSRQEYEVEMAEAAAEKEAYLAKVGNMVDESNVVMLEDAAALAEGKAIYDANCVACHGALGEGGVGPNLTDQYWIHGGSISDLFSTIKYGVPTKGMISWQAQLKPQQMQQVASYILTMQGTNPPNAKEPQGDLYVPEGEAAPAEADTTANEEVAMLAQP
ncbi:MAG: cytochrome C oxidase subunit III [Bacteroidetes bacterium]|nr:MAG: cytochrome C oxidase subunit III [Bacteroidota bacterium]